MKVGLFIPEKINNNSIKIKDKGLLQSEHIFIKSNNIEMAGKSSKNRVNHLFSFLINK